MARTTIPAMMMKQRSKVFQNFFRIAGTSKKKFESRGREREEACDKLEVGQSSHRKTHRLNGLIENLPSIDLIVLDQTISMPRG
jgi:hypothetical protein